MLKRNNKKAPLNNKSAVAITRVSTDLATQELGEAAQRLQITAFAALRGMEIVDVFCDEVSGGAALSKRVALAAALESCCRHNAAYIIAPSIDRFTRDDDETQQFERQLRTLGIELLFANGVGNGNTPTDNLLKDMLKGFAKFERSEIKRRITQTLAVKRGRGELTGKAPYGFRAVEAVPQQLTKRGLPLMVLVPCEEEQATIARARELYAVEGVSIRRVIQSLADEGKMSRSGKPFGTEAMHAILNPKSV